MKKKECDNIMNSRERYYIHVYYLRALVHAFKLTRIVDSFKHESFTRNLSENERIR